MMIIGGFYFESDNGSNASFMVRQMSANSYIYSGFILTGPAITVFTLSNINISTENIHNINRNETLTGS